MKKVILRIAILFVIFVVGVIGFSRLMNQQRTDSIREASGPVLPTLCIDYNGYKINQMYGYLQEMDQNSMRDGLIPLTTNREIKVSVLEYDNKIDSITYEVISLIDGTILENAKVGNFKKDGDYKTTTFTLQQPILMNQEYGLKFTVHLPDKDVNYYTRVVQRASINTDHYLEFAYNFYESCMNKEGASSLNMYLETADYVAGNSFADVNITSSLDQVSWGKLNPIVYRRPIATIKEINETTGSVTLSYMIAAKDDNGEDEYFYVTDFFRMRYYQSRIMLLDFERDVEQVYTANEASVTTKGIDIGVADKNVQFLTNDSNTIIAFVQGDELWSYNANADKLTKIFSMRSEWDGEHRDNFTERDIKVIRVEETGDIHFVVYGYMTADAHEGASGIDVLHYSSERNAVEEHLFIPCDRSYAYLREDMNRLSYENRADTFYVYLENAVYKVDLLDKSYTAVLENVNPECLVVSDDHSQMAWMDEMDEFHSTKITVMDLETGRTYTREAGTGNKMRVLGYVGSDLIYGIAADRDIVTDETGKTVFAMNKVVIEDSNGATVKEYSSTGYWTYDIDVKEGLIELYRVSRDVTGYVDAATDNIMNNQKDLENIVVSRASNTSRRGTVYTLVTKEVIENKKPLVAVAKLLDQEALSIVDIEHTWEQTEPMYYTYAKGKLIGIYTQPAEAVIAADAQVGVVVNTRQQYVWERGNSQTENELNNQDIPAIFLSGTMDVNVLQNGLGEKGEVMNLTGCTLEEVLYQLSEDRAVIARNPDGTTAVIVGYDRYNTLLYNFETGEHYYYGINDSTNLFLSGGNVFISYMEKPEMVTK